MQNQFRIRLPFPVFWAIAGFMGMVCFVHPVFAGDDKTSHALAFFSKVLQEVQKNYVEEPDPENLVRHAIQGMMESLDPYSVYLTPETLSQLKDTTEGGAGGIGAAVAMVDGRLTVISVKPETPAHRAGIRKGDILVEIDHESTAGMTLRDGVAKLKGPENSKILLTLIREGTSDPITCHLTRDYIPARSIRSALLDPKGLGYIAVVYFRENTVSEMISALEDLEASGKGLSGLILDLRNNPGGYLDQAVRLSDIFLEEGVIVSVKGRHAGDARVFKARKNEVRREYPMVVLINGGTASASEVVAAALQDHQRAVIAGATSYGKGSIQTVIPFPDGSGIKYTVARYYTPKNISIQDRGVIPDVEIPPDSDVALQAELFDENGPEHLNADLLRKDAGIAMALGLLSEKGNVR